MRLTLDLITVTFINKTSVISPMLGVNRGSDPAHSPTSLKLRLLSVARLRIADTNLLRYVSDPTK